MNASETAKAILAEIMVFRRIPETIKICKNSECHNCTSPHLLKILNAVEKNKPVTFVLPAFPGKSPNIEKVLGPLPDQAERLSLHFLHTLCQRVKFFYPPGIKIILCSDGRVFSDVVGMNEQHVTQYQQELEQLIHESSYNDLSTFNLDDFYKGLSYVQMRDELMKVYGTSLENLKQSIRKGAEPVAGSDEQEANRMYRGITRFLFEDASHSGQTKSRTTLQKEARIKAYQVIQRSNAWSTFIANYFPGAVRLSIHPQSCGSRKLGIRLIGNESWMTPWHGVAVQSSKGYVLLKRSEAEALGATLIYASNGRKSHFQLMAGV